MESMLRKFYPLEEPTRKRDRPMAVLALGPSRSATESMRQALLKLGYQGIYHGFTLGEGQAADALVWTRLGQAKLAGNSEACTAEEFDKCTGQTQGVCDFPAAAFGEELVKAYPEAKVVLNRRPAEAWHKSFIYNVKPIQSSIYFSTVALFESELFWMRRMTVQCFQIFFGKRDMDREGVQAYEENFERIKKLAGEGNYLEWSVQDGWEPLCKFLDKPLPAEPFPSGNDADALQQTRYRNHGARAFRAKRNILLVFLSVIGVFTAGIMQYLRHGKLLVR